MVLGAGLSLQDVEGRRRDVSAGASAMRAQTPAPVPPWLSLTLAGLTLIGVLYSASAQWFDMRYRVQRLEEHDTFMHGNIGAFVKDK